MALRKTLIASLLMHLSVFLCVTALQSGNKTSQKIFFVELSSSRHSIKKSLPQKEKTSPILKAIVKQAIEDEADLLIEEKQDTAQGGLINDISSGNLLKNPYDGMSSPERTSAFMAYGNDAIAYESELRKIKSSIERAISYPFIARKRNIQGTVLAGFSISEKGMPEDIRIFESSGSKVLDDEAIRAIKRASPYPYIKWTVEVPISFKLKEDR